VALKQFFSALPTLPSIIQLQIGLDGTSLWDSSCTQIWPIFIAIKNYFRQVLLVGAFCGTSKPEPRLFIKELVDELTHLLQNGFNFDGRTTKIELDSIICDAPGRALFKNVKLHSGYFACERCNVKGIYSGSVVFLDSNCQKRRMENGSIVPVDEHVLGPSEFCRANVDLVSQFPLDYMHLVCLGVMRRLLSFWISGPRQTCRASSITIGSMSQALLSLLPFIPREFARKPRSLAVYKSWKATEFRQFLLYTGIIVAKALPKPVYCHFMLLSCAMTILLSNTLSTRYCSYAEKLLRLFVEHCPAYYGHSFVTYNVHSLIHLSDDVRKFGCLDQVSAFPFESAMRFVKKCIRSPARPLQQLAARLVEDQQKLVIPMDSNFANDCCERLAIHIGFKEVLKNCHIKGFFIANVSPDNYIMTADYAKVYRILDIYRTFDETIVLGAKKMLADTDAFHYPLPSSKLNIYKMQLHSLNDEVEYLPAEEVVTKVLTLPMENKSEFLVMPFLHHNFS
jgi:hypothetical protein